MKAKKFNYIGLIVVYSILFVLLNIIIFVVFKPADFEKKGCIAAFWWSYAFLAISFIAQIATLFTVDKKSGIDAVFMGIPLFFISIGYFVAELFVSLLFMILSAFGVETPLELVVVLQVLLLGIYVAMFIVALMTKKTISEIGETQKKNVQNIRFMVDDVELVADMINDSNIKNLVMGLAEDIKYSDPMSTEVVADLDERLKGIIFDLKLAASSSDYSTIQTLVTSGKLIVKERNRKIASSK